MTLQSPAELQLNNLVVHDVELLVEDGRMTLTIDGLFNSSVDIAGPVRELDIQYGLYAGGTGSLDLPYLAEASSPFRGCLHLVTFNGLDVLSTLSSDGSSKIFHRVQEGCSTQFSAEPEEPFGFLGPHSYIAFPTWDAREEATIEFVITTSITQAPLIYHAGLENDFFYLEISNGRLRGFVEKGNGIIVLHNNVFISDEQQHYVKVYTNIHKFEILIDYYASSTSSRGINNYLDLQGNLFIGGMNDKALERLREHHLAFMSVWTMTNNSFVGCLEDLRINLQRRSLQDAMITKDITSGCGKQDHYWDYDEAYEQDEAPTSPPPDVWSGAPGLVVEPCRPDNSFPPAFANISRLLHVSPLIVSEGGMAYLEWKHTQPTVDLSLANIRQSQILFSITNDPRHGQLELDIPGSRSRRKFTLLDIVNRKVRYVHDGSEGPMDQLMLEVTVTAQQGVPECLRQGQMYLLPIMINPINDAPQVIFPHGNHMTVLKHTRKHLTTDILQVLDDDTSCDDLEFQLHGGQQMEEGYMEYDFHPGVPIEEFSCRDLEAGNVVYVHQSGTNLQLTLQVSDGTVPSPIATLRILAIDPDIRLHNNTGLSISQGGAARITTANLSVETNAVKQRVTILYVLTEPLRYGEVQKQGSMGGEWKKVESFHQQDLEQGRIQYFSTDPEHRLEDAVEKLRFKVQVGQKVLQNNTFLIRIKRATIKMRTMVPLQMKNKRHRNITSKELEAMLEDPNSAPVPFHYVIIQAPKKGNLELLGNRLTEGFGFTQDNLQRNHLSYSATIRNSQQAEDTFQFRVHAGEQHSPVYTYTISIGGDPDAPALTNVLLTVPEGGQAVISKDHLFVQSMNSMDYLYEVIEGPAHGKLAWAASHGWASREEITEFSNDDILHRRLLYQHDDSETLEDDIPFVAIRQGEGSAEPDAEEVRGVFRVSIQPINDHTPVQVVNKVFNVVRNGQHLLTTDNIAFTDKDSGFSDTQLVLTRKDILFGSIVSADDRSHQVYRFTQDDLRKKKILFVHSGADRGWIQLQVSDGLHQTTALLEVQASDPYIKIVNNTGLVIHQGSRGSIDSAVLSLETNMDIRSDEEIRFLITTPPRLGTVLRGEQPVMAFSQRDLLAGEISYHHNGSRNTRDELQFTVEANEVAVEDTLAISIFLGTHPSPLRIVNHKEIHVFQGEAAGIKEEYLLVSIPFSSHSPSLHHFPTHQTRTATGRTPFSPICPEQRGRAHVRLCPAAEKQGVQARPRQEGNSCSSHHSKALGGCTAVGCGAAQPLRHQPPTHDVSPPHSQVTHEEIPPQDIVYLVSSPPAFGFLAMLQHGQDSNEQPSLDPIQSFTQEDINNGRVLYLHSKPEEERDQFVVDITASSADPLEGVVVSLAMLPIAVPLDVHNITVPGGGSVTLSTGILSIPNAYFTALGMEFKVLEPPRFGTLLNSERPEDGGLHSFTWSEVEQPRVPTCPPCCFPGGGWEEARGGLQPPAALGGWGGLRGSSPHRRYLPSGWKGSGWWVHPADKERISPQPVFKRPWEYRVGTQAEHPRWAPGLLPTGILLPLFALDPPRRAVPEQRWLQGSLPPPRLGCTGPLPSRAGGPCPPRRVTSLCPPGGAPADPVQAGRSPGPGRQLHPPGQRLRAGAAEPAQDPLHHHPAPQLQGAPAAGQRRAAGKSGLPRRGQPPQRAPGTPQGWPAQPGHPTGPTPSLLPHPQQFEHGRAGRQPRRRAPAKAGRVPGGARLYRRRSPGRAPPRSGRPPPPMLRPSARGEHRPAAARAASRPPCAARPGCGSSPPPPRTGALPAVPRVPDNSWESEEQRARVPPAHVANNYLGSLRASPCAQVSYPAAAACLAAGN